MRSLPRPRSRRLWIWLAIASALGIGLAFAPLFGVLGYEHALVAAGLAAVAGLDLGAASARAAQRAPGARLACGLGGAIAQALAVAAVPGVIAAIHGIWTPTCDWAYGLHAYVLLPLASAVFAAGLGHLLAILVGTRAERRWWPHRSTWLAVVLPILVLALASFWRFYTEPPVFVYNALIGYFPGNMYDENIVLGAPLVWSRLEQFAWVGALACAVASLFDWVTYRVTLGIPRGRWAAGAAGLAIAAALVRANAGSLGYAVDAGDLQRALGGRVDTPHFVIYYARTPEIEKDIDLIARDHELRYAQVVAQIGAAPAGKLTSYYFADTDQKARLFGARNVEMAKPWQHAIFIDHRGFPAPSLRHEIAHAIAASFGDRWFGVARRGLAFNPGLIEGLAVALDWPAGDGQLTPHESVRALELLGLRPSLGEVLSIQFFRFSSARGYTTAGSFVRFLLDTYGAPKLRALYHSGGDYQAAYGKPLAALEAEWRAMIATIQLPDAVVQGAQERFRGGGVFSRPCPHAIAARRAEAFAELSRGDRARAIALIRAVCSDAPEEPQNRLALAGVLATGDPIERVEADGLLHELAADDHVTSTLRADALEKLARLSTGETPRSDADKLALIEQARALPLDPDERRQLDAEAFALAHAGPAGPALRAYFFGKITSEGIADAQHAADVEPELGLGHYLLGLQRYNVNDWDGATRELAGALAKGLPGSNFMRFGARRLAIAAYRVGDADSLARAIAALRGPDTTAVDHLLARDWEQRATFDATGHL